MQATVDRVQLQRLEPKPTATGHASAGSAYHSAGLTKQQADAAKLWPETWFAGTDILPQAPSK